MMVMLSHSSIFLQLHLKALHTLKTLTYLLTYLLLQIFFWVFLVALFRCGLAIFSLAVCLAMLLSA